MKPDLKSALPAVVAAGALALAIGGCATSRYADNSVAASSNTPAVVDAFSPRYAPFPASANESAGVTGHSFFCSQHYNQPGCQTFDTAASDRDSRHFFRRSEFRSSDSARSVE